MADREINYRFRATENVTGVASRVQQALKNARKTDRAEAIDEIAKLTKGAGALVALELLSRGVSAATKGIADFKEMSRGGTVTWGEYVEGLAKSVPIYGSVIEAGREFRKEIDGTNDAIRKAQKEAAATDAVSGVLFGTKAGANTAGKEGIELARAQAQNELDAKIKAIEDVRRANRESLTGGQHKALDKAEDEARRQHNLEGVKLERDYATERAAAVQDGENKIRDLKASVRAADLRAVHKDLEAEIVEIRAARNQQIRDLNAEIKAKQDAETDPERKAELARQRGERSRVIEHGRETAEAAAVEKDRLAREAKRLDLAGQGIEYLERELELGGGAMKLDVERLKVVEEFARKRSELKQQIEFAKPEEKGVLQGLLGGLDDQEKRALSLVGAGKFSGGLAGTESGAFLTGVSAKARETDPANQIVKWTAETAKNTKGLLDKVDAMLRTPAEPKPVPRDFK